MRKLILSTLVLFSGLNAFGQNSIPETLEKYNDGIVNYISIEKLIQLQKNDEDVVLLDARALEEYQVSHLKNATWVGYEEFDLSRIPKHIPKEDTLIVYCSIGVRSEQIGEQLQEAGYTRVFNLYGGIFNWKNQANSVYNSQGQKTDSIHAYDEKWGRLLEKGIPIYE